MVHGKGYLGSTSLFEQSVRVRDRLSHLKGRVRRVMQLGCTTHSPWVIWLPNMAASLSKNLGVIQMHTLEDTELQCPN